ncbi:MAG: hypothetical protein ABI706_09400 [Ilumatobacteraceae bacterium]
MDVLLMLLAIAVCAGLLYLGYRIEPHHVSRNGDRFLCTGQWLSPQGEADGRKREVWINVLGTGQLQVDTKRRLRHDVTNWSLEGKASSPPPRKAVYVLRTITSLGTTERMTIKIPAKSRAVTSLDEMLPSPKMNTDSSGLGN